jgi:hypothetical protein
MDERMSGRCGNTGMGTGIAFGNDLLVHGGHQPKAHHLI